MHPPPVLFGHRQTVQPTSPKTLIVVGHRNLGVLVLIGCPSTRMASRGPREVLDGRRQEDTWKRLCVVKPAMPPGHVHVSRRGGIGPQRSGWCLEPLLRRTETKHLLREPSNDIAEHASCSHCLDERPFQQFLRRGLVDHTPRRFHRRRVRRGPTGSCGHANRRRRSL